MPHIISSMNTFLVAFALLFLVVKNSMAQNVTVCSDEGVNLCTTTSQVCFSTDGNETCGNCLDGFVEFPPDGETCSKIGEVTWQEYLDFFTEIDDPPLYLEDLSPEVRLDLLHTHLAEVSIINAQIPPEPFVLGINKFSADTQPERQSLAGFRHNDKAYEDFGDLFGRTESSSGLPEQVDWVEQGVVTDIFDQGRCGCCWGISTIGAAESAAAINPENEGFLERLSVQQMLSCDNNEMGCGGGNIVWATGYAWQTDFGGIATDADYPYTDYEGETTELCQTKDRKPAVRIDRPSIIVTYGDNFSKEERIQMIKSALAVQPLSMSLQSICITFNSYSRGILTDDGGCACEDTSCIDHSLVLVGYSDTSDPPYWIVKNSWGTWWGEDGYVRISQEGGGKWGLFGMLGEAVAPLEAFKVGEEVSPEPPAPGPGPSTSGSFRMSRKLGVVAVAAAIITAIA